MVAEAGFEPAEGAAATFAPEADAHDGAQAQGWEGGAEGTWTGEAAAPETWGAAVTY